MDADNIAKLWENLPLILNKLPAPGILLVSGKNNNIKNIMTIGWMQFGIVWQQPVVNIMVRPSRFTYKLLQEHDEFTLNIMPDSFKNAIEICGIKSGSFCDKFKETNLKTVTSTNVSTVSLKDAEIVLECRILYKCDMIPENLNDIILARYYGEGDFHQIITASILNYILK